MKDIDPRLAPVVAAERGIGAFGAFLGGLMALLGGAFLAMASTKNGDLGGILIVAFFGLIFFVPGILMIRSWLRGPKAKASIRLLTVDRAELVGWDLQYVSINRGPARPRIVLHARSGTSHHVGLQDGEERQVVACLSEMAPRIQPRS